MLFEFIAGTVGAMQTADFMTFGWTRVVGWGVLVASVCLAGRSGWAQTPVPSGSAATQGTPISEEARRNFRAGVALLDDPDGARYEEAYTAFKAAYAASPSPKILGNLALCAMKIERDSEAIEAYARYLREAPGILPAERVQIERDLAMLRANLAVVSLAVNAPRFTVVDRRMRPGGPPSINVYEVEGGRVELGLRPGRHELRVNADGKSEQSLEIELALGARESRSFELRPSTALLSTAPSGSAPEPRPRPSLAGPLVVSGAAVALLAAGTVTGLVAVNKTGDIEEKCPHNRCPASYDLGGARASARRVVRLTDGLLLGGGVLGVAGVTWLMLRLTDSGDGAPRRQAGRLGGDAACSPQGCAGELRVSF